MTSESRRPFFSVIMNCYNGEEYLKRAIDSVYSQKFKDWEIIFVNNASTDSSRCIAQSYCDKLKYYQLPQTLPYGYARKFAVEQASGEWITFLDVDDFWDVRKLQVQHNRLHESNFVICYAGFYSVDIGGRVFGTTLPSLESGSLLGGQLLQFEVNTVTMALRRDILIAHNITYNGELTSSADDNIVLRLLAKGSCCVIHMPLAYYTVSQNSLSAREMKNWASDRFATATQLKLENPDSETRYFVQLREYIARGHYYSARYLMHLGSYPEARHALGEATKNRKSYCIFFILSFIPYLWDAIHQPKIKILLSKLYFKIFNIFRAKGAENHSLPEALK